jgi:choline dehydrogenase
MSTEKKTYDFIVVGGGTAGCVIAARLSEKEEVSVLLLEAGPSEPPLAASVPPAWPELLQTSANWGNSAVEQSATGTSVLLPRGRVLGGSSVINGMTFARGHHTSYDAWEREGARGWSFDALLPYFKRSESAHGHDPALRGTKGPLSVGPAVDPNPIISALLEGAAEVGHRRATDISGGLEEGFGWPDLNIADGKRQSAADAYLAPASNRPNLDVVADALVSRLVISNGRCVGIEYTSDKRPLSAYCSAEVVLTAGAVGSAQLLMLSGIGPAEHLHGVGIDPLHDLPGVGENLHDHPIINIVYNTRRPVPAGVNNHGEAVGLIRSQEGLEGPDVHILLIDSPGHMPAGMGTDSGFTLGVAPMVPHSRGTLRMASHEPTVPPVLDPNYFADDRDMVAVVNGLRMARRIARSHAIDTWHCQEVLPGPGQDDDESLRAYVRRTTASYCHPVGTCRIGEDTMAVVDADLRLRGIDGLRVADASVIPSIPSGNTNATVYAVAERAADLLGSV